MTEEQLNEADCLEREEWESAVAERRAEEDERRNRLWDEGASSRYQEELARMARDDESRRARDERRSQ